MMAVVHYILKKQLFKKVALEINLTDKIDYMPLYDFVQLYLESLDLINGNGGGNNGNWQPNWPVDISFIMVLKTEVFPDNSTGNTNTSQINGPITVYSEYDLVFNVLSTNWPGIAFNSNNLLYNQNDNVVTYEVDLVNSSNDEIITGSPEYNDFMSGLIQGYKLFIAVYFQ